MRRRTHLRRIHSRKRERVAKIGCQHERERPRPTLLGAAVGILDEIPRAFTESDHRRGRQLDVQAAETRHDARGNHQRLGRRGIRVGGFAIGGNGFWRHEQFDWNHVFERIGLLADLDRHPHAGSADPLTGRVEARLD